MPELTNCLLIEEIFAAGRGKFLPVGISAHGESRHRHSCLCFRVLHSDFTGIGPVLHVRGSFLNYTVNSRGPKEQVRATPAEGRVR
jgi:hypothetical protein